MQSLPMSTGRVEIQIPGHFSQLLWPEHTYGLLSIVMTPGRRTRTIRIYCADCGCLLYKYQKGGPGRLVKCFKDRIVKDFTAGDLRCPDCGQEFARETMVYRRPANKIIQGKVTVRG